MLLGRRSRRQKQRSRRRSPTHFRCPPLSRAQTAACSRCMWIRSGEAMSTGDLGRRAGCPRLSAPTTRALCGHLFWATRRGAGCASGRGRRAFAAFEASACPTASSSLRRRHRRTAPCSSTWSRADRRRTGTACGRQSRLHSRRPIRRAWSRRRGTLQAGQLQQRAGWMMDQQFTMAVATSSFACVCGDSRRARRETERCWRCAPRN